MTLSIAFTTRPTRDERHAIAQGLGDYNREAYGPLRGGERWFFARDQAGMIQAGARCDQAWDWLYVDWLWVAAAYRRQGWGGRLLAETETFARDKALVGVHLHTWSFQAPDFYRKQGYTEAGHVADMPRGVTRWWFVKRFA